MKSNALKKIIILAITGSLLLTATSCGTNDSVDRKKANTISCMVSGTPDRIDVASPTANMLIFSIAGYTQEGLYKYDENGNSVLGMASSCEVTDDGTTLTYKLRDDIYWNDGVKVTSDDFRFGFEHHLEPATGSTAVDEIITSVPLVNIQEVYKNGASMDTLGIETPDDSTIILHLTRPGIAVEDILSNTIFPIRRDIYAQYGNQYGSSSDKLLCNGAYVIKDFKPLCKQFRLEKNPYYYAKDDVKIDVAEYRVLDSKYQTVMCFNTDLSDVVMLEGEEAALRQSLPEYISVPAPSLYMEILKMDDPIMSNMNIRRALSLAVDRNKIVEDVYKADASVSYAYVPPAERIDDVNVMEEGCISEWHRYDPDAAKECWERGLAELGLQEVTITITTTQSSSGFVYPEKEQWEKTLPGLKVNVSIQGQKLLQKTFLSGDYQIITAGWNSLINDPIAMLQLFSSDGYFKADQYHDSDFDAMLAESSTTEVLNDKARRDEILTMAETKLLDDVAVIPIYNITRSYLVNTKLQPAFNSDSTLDLIHSYYK